MILDPETASVATGVPARTIRRWALQGRLVDHGGDNRIMVNIDEVAELNTRRLVNNGQLPKRPYVA